MKNSLFDEEPTVHIGPAIPGAEELPEVFVGRYLRLETLGEGFVLERLQAPYSVGGDIIVARARKPSR